MLDDFRIFIAARTPARVLVQDVKEVVPLPEDQYNFPLYSQYQSSRGSLHGGRPGSRPQAEVEADPEINDEDPIEKRPPVPVPSSEPGEVLAGSSTDSPPNWPRPADPFPISIILFTGSE